MKRRQDMKEICECSGIIQCAPAPFLFFPQRLSYTTRRLFWYASCSWTFEAENSDDV